MKRTLFLLTLPLFLSAAEPSVFGAGNLDSENPYGLTETEKHIVKNRNTLDTIKSSSRLQENKVVSIEEKIDGLQTIIEGIGQKNHKSSMAIRNLENQMLQRNELYTQDKEVLEKSITEIREITAANSENTIKLKVVLTEFSQLIDTINSNYVSKREYNALVKDVNSFKTLIASELKAVNRSIVSSTGTSMSNPDLANRAHKRYKKGEYSRAIEDYELLIKNQYKPARAHYMIAESYYYLKNYSQALAFFKESASRYDKADYMPTLMLHSAVSMKKLGDNENARAFLSAVISEYPESSQATSAQKELDKLSE